MPQRFEGDQVETQMRLLKIHDRDSAPSDIGHALSAQVTWQKRKKHLSYGYPSVVAAKHNTRSIFQATMNQNMPLSKLKGLGPKSQKCLNEIGIFTREDLARIGPIQAFIKLKKECTLMMKPSLNFLYAMVGALEGRHWKDIAKHEKGRLLMELEGYEVLEGLLSTKAQKQTDE